MYKFIIGFVLLGVIAAEQLEGTILKVVLRKLITDDCKTQGQINKIPEIVQGIDKFVDCLATAIDPNPLHSLATVDNDDDRRKIMQKLCSKKDELLTCVVGLYDTSSPCIDDTSSEQRDELIKSITLAQNKVCRAISIN